MPCDWPECDVMPTRRPPDAAGADGARGTQRWKQGLRMGFAEGFLGSRVERRRGGRKYQ
jgi:hypothetical protein